MITQEGDELSVLTIFTNIDNIVKFYDAVKLFDEINFLKLQPSAIVNKINKNACAT